METTLLSTSEPKTTIVGNVTGPLCFDKRKVENYLYIKNLRYPYSTPVSTKQYPFRILYYQLK